MGENDISDLRRELEFLREAEQHFKECLMRLGASTGSVEATPLPKPPARSVAGYVRNRVSLIEQQFHAGQQQAWSRERLFAAIKESPSADVVSEDPVEAELSFLRDRLLIAKQRRLAAQGRRVELAKKLREARQLRDEVERRVNQLTTQCAHSLDELKATRDDAANTATQLNKFSEISVINDAFYIWFSGSFATINNFRLGNSPVGRQVEWMEINAALGQAMLVVSIIAARAGMRFRQYTLHPFGSFSKVSKNDDRRVMYPLFMDPTLFSLFPKSKFHPAMFGFLCCIKELGEYISAHDPPLAIPHRLELEEGRPPRISSRAGGEQLELYRGSDDLAWTKALKLLLSDIKWMIAWSTKHTLRQEGRRN